MSAQSPRGRSLARSAKHKKNVALPLMGIRLQQIQRVLDQVLTWETPADVVLSQWFKQNKNLGGRDRAEIAESVFDILRHLRRYRHYAESGVGPLNKRLAILGLSQCVDNHKLSGALDETERRWLDHLRDIDESTLAPAIRYSLPDWLYQHLQSFEDAEFLMRSLNEKAPLDLRVNSLKVDRDQALIRLQTEIDRPVQMVPTPFSPWGIRLNEKPALNRWPLFLEGGLEVQDEGSQILGLLVQPKRGEMVVDYCAGAGGKTLLLGALMRSTGRLYAFDVSASRLARAKPRIARSGLSNVTPVVISKERDERVKRLAGKVHRVLVDAPCTGLGTLRRNPDLKWRQQPSDLAELLPLQAQILKQAATLVMPGGRLVYSTCSLLPEENDNQVKEFLTSHPDFEVMDVNQILSERCPKLRVDGPYLHLRPDVHQTDGFFAAVLQRKK